MRWRARSDFNKRSTDVIALWLFNRRVQSAKNKKSLTAARVFSRLFAAPTARFNFYVRPQPTTFDTL
jgi:hypothetical protein